MSGINDFLRQIEDSMGSEGSRKQAEAVYNLAKSRGMVDCNWQGEFNWVLPDGVNIDKYDSVETAMCAEYGYEWFVRLWAEACAVNEPAAIKQRQTPALSEYTNGIAQFLEQSADWRDLNENKFYTVSACHGFEESCDNANGGIDCSWAFKRAEMPEREEILAHYIACLENLLEIAEDAESWEIVSDIRKALEEF